MYESAGRFTLVGRPPWRSILGLFALCWIGAGAAWAGLPSRTLQGESCHDLRAIAHALGMEAAWGEPAKTLRLHSRWSELEFTKDERSFVCNGVKVHLGRAAVAYGNSLWITKLDFERTVQPLLAPQVFASQTPGPIRRILIDPGHGGKDPGTINNQLRLREKSLTLDLAARVERLLRAEGYEVALTRRDDEFLELAERGAMARTKKADLFLSLHFNAAGNTKVEGIETYAFTPRNQPSTARGQLHPSDREVYRGNGQDAWNALLAFHIQRELIGLPRAQDRGLKRARWDVLRDLECPGVLIEGGFLSSNREGSDIGSAAYRDQLAAAIVAGVKAYEERLAGLR